MIEALRYSYTSDLTRATRRNFPEDGILHSHRSENLKSYKLPSFSFSYTFSKNSGQSYQSQNIIITSYIS
jgi:hypothetical protein